MEQIERLHVITQEVTGATHAELAVEACKSGAKWIQVRVKDKSFDEWKEIALSVKKACRKYGAKLIVNDNVELARQIEADGVHLGKKDMMPQEARAILGQNFLIGGTANNFKDIIYLASAKVDYIGLGPFRFTNTKKGLSPTLGFEGYRNLINRCKKEDIYIPIIAIGGIRIEDVPFLKGTGIYGMAVASAINLAADRGNSCKQFLTAIQERF